MFMMFDLLFPEYESHCLKEYAGEKEEELIFNNPQAQV